MDGDYVTKSGKVLTDAEIEALADDAEQGHDEATWAPDGKPDSRRPPPGSGGLL